MPELENADDAEVKGIYINKKKIIIIIKFNILFNYEIQWRY